MMLMAMTQQRSGAQTSRKDATYANWEAIHGLTLGEKGTGTHHTSGREAAQHQLGPGLPSHLLMQTCRVPCEEASKMATG